MSNRQSTAKRPVFSASAVLEAVASELSVIKAADGLTDADLGRVLGKSEDQAAKYRAGLAEMGVVAFAAAKREWNGRFTGALDRLCVESRPGVGKGNDRSVVTAVTKALYEISVAMEDDEVVSPEEVRVRRKALEQGRDAFNELLSRLPTPMVAA